MNASSSRTARSRPLRLLVLALAAAGAAAVAAPLQAQVPTDAHWMAWLGCWEPVGPGTPADAPAVCVHATPGEPGVLLATVANGKVVSEHRIIADGAHHEVTEGGCRGWEAGLWSDDGRYLYRRGELSCDGGTGRTTSGVFAFVTPQEWVEIEAAGAGQDRGLRVVHYRLMNRTAAQATGLLPTGEDLAIQTARTVDAGPLRVSDVIAASTRIDPVVLQHLIYERRDPFDLNARALEDLADAHIPAEVIDMMVALTYPQDFSMEGAFAQVAERPDTTKPGGGPGVGGPWYPPVGGWCYGAYGYNSWYPVYGNAYFAPWSSFYFPGRVYGYYDGCGGYGGYGGYYGPVYGGYGPYGGVVVVRGNGDDSRGGQVIRGRGHTPPTDGSGATGRTAHPRNGSASGSSGRSASGGSYGTGSSSGSSGSTSSGSGSSGGDTRGGSSSGGTSTGRSAHPR